MNSLFKEKNFEDKTAANFLRIADGVKCAFCVVSRKNLD
jgi:hypothetical protein